MRILKRQFKFTRWTCCLLIPVFFFIILAVTSFFHVIPNNMMVKKVLKQVKAAGAPSGSMWIDDLLYVGWVDGNGPHCDLVAGVLYETVRPANDVFEYYKNITLFDLDSDNPLIIVGYIEKGKIISNSIPGAEDLYLNYINRFIYPLTRKCQDDKKCFIIYEVERNHLYWDNRCAWF